MLKIYDRRHEKVIEEKVFGGEAILWAYGTPLGRAIVDRRWIQGLVSRLAGDYYDSALSARGIPDFVRAYDIRMEDYVTPVGGFDSFNDFFVRPFRPGLRGFPEDSSRLGAPAEGRLSLFEIRDGRARLSIKDTETELGELLGSLAAAAPREGHAWVFRLCPVDYHCFHFPDAGRVLAHARVSGDLHSVNPVAQTAIPGLFFRNEREATLLDSENFGRLALVEVGAICVGLIRQLFSLGDDVKRGQAKGYFKFGASTVVLVTDARHVRPDPDLVERSLAGTESLVRLGEGVGTKVPV